MTDAAKHRPGKAVMLDDFTIVDADTREVLAGPGVSLDDDPDPVGRPDRTPPSISYAEWKAMWDKSGPFPVITHADAQLLLDHIDRLENERDTALRLISPLSLDDNGEYTWLMYEHPDGFRCAVTQVDCPVVLEAFLRITGADFLRITGGEQ